MDKLCPNYVEGAFLWDKNQKTFTSTNPANPNTILAVFPESTETDVTRAVDAAKNAFRNWKNLGPVKRSEYLWRLAQLIEKHRYELEKTMVRESGKQWNEAIAEVAEALHMCQMSFSNAFRGEIGSVLADEIPDKLCSAEWDPRGVVVAITPWNFPIAIPLWCVGPSLAIGNTVILKPSEETPYCAHLLAELIHEAGFPPGVFQLLHGRGEGVGKMLVAHPDVNSVLFTGSLDVGREIKKEVALHDNKICTIETGSKSAVIVLDDADMDRFAIPAAIASAFKTAGQRCVSASRIIVDRKRYREFCEKFVRVARQLHVDNPFILNAFYGTMINAAGVAKGKLFNQRARDEGFKILLDRNGEAPPTPNGHWLYPFVYTGEWDSDSYVLTNESFSPHVAIILVDDVEEAVRVYNDTRYGLSVAVITDNYRKAHYVKMHADAGLFYWNLPCIGAGVRLPFGGVKGSGNLIPAAAGILPAIAHYKASTINYGHEIQMAQGLKIDV